MLSSVVEIARAFHDNVRGHSGKCVPCTREHLIEEPEETFGHKKTKMLGHYNSDPVLVSARSVCFDLPVPGYIMVSALTVDHKQTQQQSNDHPSHR